MKNLEQFGIDPNEFAHQLQMAAASSTTGKYYGCLRHLFGAIFFDWNHLSD